MRTVTDNTETDNTITDRGPLGLGLMLSCGLLAAALVLAACGCVWLSWIARAI